MPNPRRMQMATAGSAGGGGFEGGGTLWAWGNGTSGLLGNGATLNKSSPVQIGSLEDWITVEGKGYAIALKSDGTLWGWGAGYKGPQGHNNETDYSSPVQVGTGTDWGTPDSDNDFALNRSIGGGAFSMAIKQDGTLWAIGGDNEKGNFGLGDTTNRSSPVQVGSLTDWSQVDCGDLHFIAIKTDGTMWSCGDNSSGRLADGSTTNRSSPVQIGSGTYWAKVSCGPNNAAAIRTDGSLWTWGPGANGILGNGATLNKSSPVQVGALTTWSEVDVSGYHMIARKTDNTLWAWGNNYYGRLGTNSDQTVNQSSPVQAGSDKTWSKIYSSDYNDVFGILSNGTLWSWGENNQGQGGRGDTSAQSSPVQIGSLTDWFRIAGAGNAIFGIKTP